MFIDREQKPDDVIVFFKKSSPTLKKDFEKCFRCDMAIEHFPFDINGNYYCRSCMEFLYRESEKRKADVQ